MSIPDPHGEGKKAGGRMPADLLIILILLLSCTAAFGLGVLTGREMGKGGDEGKLWIEELSTEGSALQAGVAAAPSITVTDVPVAEPVGVGKYVASKSGTKYHLPTCSGAKRIKEENKVWFQTKEEAQAAGYEPAANCKGL